MIAVGQRQAGRQRVQPVVDEGVGAGRPDGQRAQGLVVRALAEGDDDLEIGHHRQLALQERPALGELDGQRLVLGRQAAHGIGDAAIDQMQPVVGVGAVDALGEAELQQGRVQQVAGIVAGEGPAGAVGALHSGRQPDDQHARVEIAERAHRGVLPIGVFALELVPEGDEPGTARTVEWRLVETLRSHWSVATRPTASALRTGHRRARRPGRAGRIGRPLPDAACAPTGCARSAAPVPTVR